MKMAMRLFVATFIFLFALPVAWAQSADDAIVLSVIPIGTTAEVNADLHAAERERIDEAILDSSKDSGRYAARVSPLDLAAVRIGFDCDSDYSDCMSQLGRRAKAEQVLWGELDKRSDQWDLSLNILDTTSRRIIHQKTWTFPAGEGALDDMILAVSAFVEGKETVQTKPKGTVRIESDPAGATVRVDGTVYGETPSTVTLTVGAHVVEVSLVDRGTKTRNITVKPNKMTRLAPFRFAEKAPEVAVRMAPAEKKNWRFWTGVGALSVATVSGVGSLYFLGERDAALGEAENLVEAERDRYDQLETDFHSAQTLMVVSATTAGIAAVSGLYLLFLSDTTTTAAVVPTFGGLSVHATF